MVYKGSRLGVHAKGPSMALTSETFVGCKGRYYYKEANVLAPIFERSYSIITLKYTSK